MAGDCSYTLTVVLQNKSDRFPGLPSLAAAKNLLKTEYAPDKDGVVEYDHAHITEYTCGNPAQRTGESWSFYVSEQPYSETYSVPAQRWARMPIRSA